MIFKRGEIVEVVDMGGIADAMYPMDGDLCIVAHDFSGVGADILHVIPVFASWPLEQSWYAHRFKSTGKFMDAV